MFNCFLCAITCDMACSPCTTLIISCSLLHKFILTTGAFQYWYQVNIFKKLFDVDKVSWIMTTTSCRLLKLLRNTITLKSVSRSLFRSSHLNLGATSWKTQKGWSLCSHKQLLIWLYWHLFTYQHFMYSRLECSVAQLIHLCGYRLVWTITTPILQKMSLI